MGYLPVMLALAGFIFLWSVVNYNSMRSRKAAVTDRINLLRANAEKRKELFEKMGVLEPRLKGHIREAIKLLEQQGDTTFKASESQDREKRLAQTIEELNSLHEEIYEYRSGVKEFIAEVELLSKDAEQIIRTLPAYIRDYNLFVSKAPTRLLARPFGFLPLGKVRKV